MKKNGKNAPLLNPRTWFQGDQTPAEKMGLGMGTALFLLALIAFLRDQPLRAEKISLIAAVVAGLAIVYPRVLLPLEKILRQAVLGLAWLNTKLMLALVYYSVFTPARFLLKLFGKKLLEREFRGKADSYFEPKEEKEYRPDQDELQF